MLKDYKTKMKCGYQKIAVASEYFKELFTTCSVIDSGHMLLGVTPILESMNDELSVTFTEDEVWETIKGMAPLKASSVNGFPTLFLYKY